MAPSVFWSHGKLLLRPKLPMGLTWTCNRLNLEIEQLVTRSEKGAHFRDRIEKSNSHASLNSKARFKNLWTKFWDHCYYSTMYFSHSDSISKLWQSRTWFLRFCNQDRFKFQIPRDIELFSQGTYNFQNFGKWNSYYCWLQICKNFQVCFVGYKVIAKRW